MRTIIGTIGQRRGITRGPTRIVQIIRHDGIGLCIGGSYHQSTGIDNGIGTVRCIPVCCLIQGSIRRRG